MLFFSKWKDALYYVDLTLKQCHYMTILQKKKTMCSKKTLTPILVLYKQWMELGDSKYRDYCKLGSCGRELEY